jgi:hypothetical protein
MSAASSALERDPELIDAKDNGGTTQTIVPIKHSHANLWQQSIFELFGRAS